MTASTHQQLDDFARRLSVLETELAELREQADGPDTYVAPHGLERIRDLFEGGYSKRAVAEADGMRNRMFEARQIEQLEELLELLEHMPSTGSVERLAVVTRRNVEYLRGATTPARPAPDRRLPFAPPNQSPQARERVFTLPQLSAADMFGARGLAIAGGVVTLLGIVFFFVLAVDRGWIGPSGRIALGAAAAFAVFAGGLELRRRYGTTHAALAAAGAGIAGAYATVLAAAALYHMLPDWGGLLASAVIASVGVATSLRWRSQIVACIGLVGAILVPVAAVAQDGMSTIGTGFAGIVFVATAVVAIRSGWHALLVAGALGSAPQIAAFVLLPRYESQSPTDVVVVAAMFSALYVAAGVVRQLRWRTSAFAPLSTSFTLGGGGLAAVAALRLFATSEQRGLGLLAIALAYAVAAGLLFAHRDLSASLAFGALTIGGFAFGELLSGQPLAYAWAAEAPSLSWLARRAREIRFQAWSVVYLLLTLGHVLAIDSPVRRLLAETAHPAAGAPAVVALALASTAVAYGARPWTTPVPRIFTAFATSQTLLRTVATWLAATAAPAALSLCILAVIDFSWAQVMLAGLWCGIALALVVCRLRVAGLAWLAVAALISVTQGFAKLGEPQRAWSFVVVAGTLIAVATVHALATRRDDREPVSLVAPAVALLLLVYPIWTLLDGRTQGLALLGAGALYCTFAVVFGRLRRSRDTVTLFWALGLGLGLVAEPILVHGTVAVLGWAVAGTALAWLTVRANEPRLRSAACIYLVVAAGRALVVQAPLDHLFIARTHPAAGSLSLLFAAAAIAVASRFLPRRDVSYWSAGVLFVYGTSLVILELVERLSAATLHTEFQRGHTAVSAFWAVLGLALLYGGLSRSSRPLRLAGLAVFVVSLGKIFLFDLTSLSSIARAFSFLAVGAVLLLGGFFYQRLGQDRAGA